MENPNKKASGVMSGIIRRLKASGLDPAALERAINAVRGHKPPKPVELSPSLRKTLMHLVKQKGPLVLTGRKKLKVYSLGAYREKIETIKKHKPWERRGRIPAVAVVPEPVAEAAPV